MIPASPSTKPVAFYDTECYQNLWLLKIRVQNGPLYSFTLRSGESFDNATCGRIYLLCSLFTLVSFNGNYYDVPMLSAALHGFTTEQLKWLSDEIIVNGTKPWKLGAACEWKPEDHIDIMEVLPGAGSQKMYAGRIHCKTMQDLPFEPSRLLSEDDICVLDAYCENDLNVLEALYTSLAPQLEIRIMLGKREGLDLRSKSDAQMGEAIIKRRCEQALGQRIYKLEPDWNVRFRYDPPAYLSYQSDALKQTFDIIRNSVFELSPSGYVDLPPLIKGLKIPIGNSIFRMGIGGLHSSEESIAHFSDDENVLWDIDVESYYPRLIVNSGECPPALGPTFTVVFDSIITERLGEKKKEKTFKEAGIDTKSQANWEAYLAHCFNEGLKVGINGPFGKLGNPGGILFAPKLLIQTTVTGQLALLMLIEWFDMQGIPTISANTDGVVIKCPRSKIETAKSIIAYWERSTGLKMERTEYAALYSRDVNAYIAVKANGETKCKGTYGNGGLVEKISPNVDICGDAVAAFLSKGIPILYTVAACRDIRKFVRVQQVNGGAVKLWGHGPRKDLLVRDIEPILQANGWYKTGRKWSNDKEATDARSAYISLFPPQRPEFIGKVVRWYYSVDAPGPIIYNTNTNLVGDSYGAKPCQILPDEFPTDIDYQWYLARCNEMLKEVGYAHP